MNFDDIATQQAPTTNTRPAALITDPLSAQIKGWTIKADAKLPSHPGESDPVDQLVWIVGYGTEFDPENGTATTIHQAKLLAEVAEAHVIRRANAHEAEGGQDIDGWDDLYDEWPAMDLMAPMAAAHALISY